MHKSPAAASVLALALGSAAIVVIGQPTPVPVVLGVDHVPVAVRDLPAAARRYEHLGFTLKPGRPHANGLSNQHAKFRDGTEIELITAPDAVDELTRTYRTHLSRGEGPAFLALFAPETAALMAGLRRAGVAFEQSSGLVIMPPAGPLGYVFFGRRNASPTDRPEHVVHRNTARSLRYVWLAADDLAHERRLLEVSGARFTEEEVFVPDPTRATVARFREGSVVLLPRRHQVVPGHRIVGMTVVVGDLSVTRAVVGTLAEAAHPSAGDRVFVAPRQALGYWLEFRAEGR